MNVFAHRASTTRAAVLVAAFRKIGGESFCDRSPTRFVSLSQVRICETFVGDYQLAFIPVRDKFHSDQRDLAGALNCGPREGELGGRFYDLVDTGMFVDLVFAFHGDVERAAYAHIQHSLGRHHIAGTHPLPHAFGIDPGLVDDFAWGRHSPAGYDPMLSISGGFHGTFLSSRL